MVHDCIVIRFLHACHFFVSIEHRPKTLIDGFTFHAKSSREKLIDLTELLFIKHGHFCLASPTP